MQLFCNQRSHSCLFNSEYGVRFFTNPFLFCKLWSFVISLVFGDLLIHFLILVKVLKVLKSFCFWQYFFLWLFCNRSCFSKLFKNSFTCLWRSCHSIADGFFSLYFCQLIFERLDLLEYYSNRLKLILTVRLYTGVHAFLLDWFYYHEYP